MSKKIKILHLIKSLGRGGAEKLIPETVALHDKEQFEFYCLHFLRRPDNLEEELREQGVKVSCFPAGNFSLFFLIKVVRNYIRDNQIDIIHCHLPWAGVLGRIVGSMLGVKVIYTEHNIWERYNRISYWLNKLTFFKQEVAIAVSESVKESIQSNYKLVNPGLVRVIPNGVNVDCFQKNPAYRDRIRKLSSIPASSVVIGTVAVFRTQKRLDLWLKLARRIWETNSNVHFMIVGDGDLRALVESCIDKGDFSHNVHLVGVQKNVIPYLSAMDIYMGTSKFEGLPIAMLEGMACRLPVLSTRAGGIGEVVEDGKHGFLCGIDEVEGLYEKAMLMIKDISLRTSMGEAARSRVIEAFSMQRMVGELEEVYLSLVPYKETLTFEKLPH